MADGGGAYLQVTISGDLTVIDPAPLRERGFVDALAGREVAFAAWFGPLARAAWPALRIVQCQLQAVDHAATLPRETRFQSRDGAQLIGAQLDTAALAGLASDVRADQVFRIAITLLADVFRKRRLDAAPLLAWRDAHLRDAGDVSMPAIKDAPARTGKRAAKSAVDVAALLPVVRLIGGSGEARRFHTAWLAEDDGGNAVVVDVRGRIGDYNATTTHACAPGESVEDALRRVMAPSLAAGLRPFDDADGVDVEIVYAIDGFGSDADLAFRHALEDELGDVLRASGIGEVDGGETGCGEMAVLLTLIDDDGAEEALRAWLAESGRPPPRRIAVGDDVATPRA